MVSELMRFIPHVSELVVAFALEIPDKAFVLGKWACPFSPLPVYMYNVHSLHFLVLMSTQVWASVVKSYLPERLKVVVKRRPFVGTDTKRCHFCEWAQNRNICTVFFAGIYMYM